MKEQFRFLILEDVNEDAELMVDELKLYGINFLFKVVANEEDFKKELDEFEPDLLLSDFSLPMFTGLEAIKYIQKVKPETPIIIVTGSISEETAVMCMKLGAADYVLKSNLTRLGIAVESALEKKKLKEQRKEAYTALKKAARIINNSPAVAFIWEYKKNWPVKYVSENVETIFGYSVNDFISGNISYTEVIHKDDIKRVKNESEFFSRGKGYVNFIHKPYRIITKSGEIKWVKDLTRIIRNDVDGITSMEGILIDITKEVKLEQEAERLARIFEESLNEIYIFEVDTYKFIQINNSAQVNLGYSLDELLEMTVLDIKDDFDIDSFSEFVKPLVEYKFPRIVFETVHRRKNGSHYDVEVHLQLLTYNGGKVFYAICLDITQRKVFEKKIIESENFLSSIIDNIPNMIFVKDAKYLKFVRYNKAATEITGIPEGEILGKTDYDFSPKEEADFFVSKDRLVLEERKMVEIPEEQVHTRNKGIRILHTKKIPIYAEDGEPQFLLGISEDITDKIELQKQLAESEKKFRLMATNTLDLIWAVDKDMNYTFINDAVFDLLGYTVYEYMQKDIREITAPEYIPIFEANLKEGLLKGKNGELFQLQFEVKRIRKDGKLVDVEVIANPIYDENKNLLGFHGRTRDITERKRKELEMEQKNEELLRFNRHFVGRENRMIKLKSEINELLRQLGQPPKYESVENIEESLKKL